MVYTYLINLNIYYIFFIYSKLMNLINSTNYLLYNEELDNINLNNFRFPKLFILNNYSQFNVNSIILDSNENSDNNSYISIGHFTNREINILNFDFQDNNNPDNYKIEEGLEKTINFKNEEISNDSTIFTKGIYENNSKQMINDAMNEKKIAKKLRIRP